MEHVSPEYEKQLERLAETLCTIERFTGGIVLLEVEKHFIEDNVIELRPDEDTVA